MSAPVYLSKRGRARSAPYVPPPSAAQLWNEARQNVIYWQEKSLTADLHLERVQAGALAKVWKHEAEVRRLRVEGVAK